VFMMFNPQKGDNLGHAAHLGGALFGLAVVVVYAPEIVIHHAFYLGVMALPLGYMGVRLLKK
jgi:rhomboid family protein